jgi:hypothetical protein
MIGGTDIVIPATGDSEALDVCARIVQQYWPHARFEDAITGETYSRCSDLPTGRVREVFVYRDLSAEAAWDSEDPKASLNTMIYLILSDKYVTAVVDDPNGPEIQPILQSIQKALAMTILNNHADAQFGEGKRES